MLETTVGGVLREAAERDAGAIALVEGAAESGRRRRWTYGDLLADSEGVARALLGRFEPGERVAMWAPNSPEWLLVEFGAALAGLTLVTVNPALLAGELEHVLRQSRAQGIVMAPAYRGSDLGQTLAQVRGGLPELRETISLADWDDFAGSGSPAERLPEVRPDDAAQIQYTSGTTGFPKGAVLHHPGHHQQCPLLDGDPAGRPRRRLGQPDAPVPHGRLRPAHAGGRAGRIRPGPAARLRRRPGAAPDRVRARHHARRRAHHAAGAAGAPGLPGPGPLLRALRNGRRRHRRAGRGPPGRW